MAEFWYNTSYHSSLGVSPFEALYGFRPTPWADGPYWDTNVEGVAELLRTKQAAHQQIKAALQRAQDRMKVFADHKRSDRVFEVGEWVYLKLKPYRQTSLHSKKIWKLSPKYAGPFQILVRIGNAAYRLSLPSTAKLHPVFHVSLLKKKIGPVTEVSPTLPDFDDDGKVLLQPVQILARRLVKKGKSPATQLLVQWAHLPETEATWEYLADVRQRYPNLLA